MRIDLVSPSAFTENYVFSKYNIRNDLVDISEHGF